MRVVIIGGGFMGQLIHMLVPDARCLDWQPLAPSVANRQLGAQYLWEPVRELMCRQFDVYTGIDGKDATEESILAYKKKVGKEQDESDWRTQFQPKMTGYEIVRMPANRVEYGMSISTIDGAARVITTTSSERVPYDVLISTVPLPFMAGLLGYVFQPESRPVYVHTSETVVRTEMDHWTVNYNSDPEDPVYRSTVRGTECHLEALNPSRGGHASWRRLIPGKIYKHPDTKFIREALAASGIYCFGRYARWEPEELAHETLNSARIFIRSGGLA